MKDLSPAELASLLKQAADAHHVYEQTELNGHHDEAWAEWYANWILAKLSEQAEPPSQQKKN